jgi:hypothetical protein
MAWVTKRTSIATAQAVFFALVAGCGSSSSTGDAALDGGVDSPSTGNEAGPISETGSGPVGSLTGTVRDQAGLVILGAKILVAGLPSVFSDAQGKFTLANIPAGAVTFTVTQNWFQPLQQSVTVAGATPVDIVLTEMPLKVDPADRTLAAAYNQTFDWTKQTLSIAIVETPTRRAFDNAVYVHNPALYRDTSAQAAITPSPQPQIAATGASNFTFPVTSGTNQGTEALDVTTIVDSIKDTPLGPTEPADFMMWSPMINWLTEWSAAKSVSLKLVGLAVRQQGWGSNAIRPQDIEKVFLDPVTQRLWVKVVFENFVQLGSGITDDDGDGRKEVYAAIAPAHYTSEIIAALTGTYRTVTFSTHSLSAEVTKSLNEIYSTTGAQLERYIGQPFDIAGLGTIAYPFVVLKHAAGQENVILVASASGL